MGKYQSYSRKEVQPDKLKEIHPIWRGIGFLMMILIPVISYFGMRVIIDLNQSRRFFPYPSDLLARGGDPLLYIRIIIACLIAFILYFFFMLTTFLVYRLFGPSRYGPFDIESKRYRGKKFKR